MRIIGSMITFPEHGNFGRNISIDCSTVTMIYSRGEGKVTIKHIDGHTNDLIGTVEGITEKINLGRSKLNDSHNEMTIKNLTLLEQMNEVAVKQLLLLEQMSNHLKPKDAFKMIDETIDKKENKND